MLGRLLFRLARVVCECFVCHLIPLPCRRAPATQKGDEGMSIGLAQKPLWTMSPVPESTLIFFG